MTERQPRTVDTEPTVEAPAPPFEVEDRTAPEFQSLAKEAYALRKWVQAEREAGHRPN